MSLSNPNTIISKERLNAFYKAIVPYLGATSSDPTVLSEVLTAGSTSVTFDISNYGENCLVNFHASRGYEFSSMSQSNGIITLTYSPALFDITVFCEITEVTV